MTVAELIQTQYDLLTPTERATLEAAAEIAERLSPRDGRVVWSLVAAIARLEAALHKTYKVTDYEAATHLAAIQALARRVK